MEKRKSEEQKKRKEQEIEAEGWKWEAEKKNVLAFLEHCAKCPVICSSGVRVRVRVRMW